MTFGRLMTPNDLITMEQIEPIRKACDLCYRRRIKCDGQKPRCSHCVIYNSDCTRKTAARKSTQKRSSKSSREAASRDAALESRVKSLEDQLSSALQKLKSLENTCPSGEAPCISNVSSMSAGDNISSSTRSLNLSHNDMPLDSLHDVLPVVEWYLATSNSFLPLFDPSNLLTAVKDWYYKPHAREPTVWAMINVVIALAHHNGYPGRKSHSIHDTTYIKNAQSVLTDAIAQQTSLTHVQVLIGLTMLFRTANEPTPAVVLIATALRLAHKLGIHRKRLNQHDSAPQRDRVFWIAYILDRSISSQTSISPVQRDNDIDLDLPPLEPVNGDLAGFVVADNGRIKFNFLRASIQMARIQGLVHEYVYSVPGDKCSSTETARRIALIHRELDAWTAQVPPEFHATALLQSGDSEVSRQFCMLYSARLSRRGSINHGSAADSFHYSNWVETLQSYGESLAAGQVVSHTPEQHGWVTLINESRDFLKLLMTVQSRDAVFTMTTLCAYVTSLLCLVSNNMFNTHSDTSLSDDKLIEAAILPLGDIAKHTSSEEIFNAIQQLRSYTHAISPHLDWQRGDLQSDQAWAHGAKPLDPDVLQYLFGLPDNGFPWNLGNVEI